MAVWDKEGPKAPIYQSWHAVCPPSQQQRQLCGMKRSSSVPRPQTPPRDHTACAATSAWKWESHPHPALFKLKGKKKTLWKSGLGKPWVIIPDPMLRLLVMRKRFILSSFTYFKCFGVLHSSHRISELLYQPPEHSWHSMVLLQALNISFVCAPGGPGAGTGWACKAWDILYLHQSGLLQCKVGKEKERK